MKKRVLAVLLCMGMLFSIGGAVCAEEEKPSETVYVLLDAAGGTKEILVRTGGAEQKEVKGELPFTVKISPLFQGKPAVFKDMLGKDGDVKITVDIQPNSKAKSYYKDSLALQMQFPIDTADGLATNLVANGLTGVTVGSVRTLSGIVLPAKSASYEISYHTTSFSLQSINFVCMPFDLTGTIDMDISSIKPQITELENGIAQYVDGVGQLSKGISQTNAGLKELAANGKALSEGVAQAATGTESLLQALLATLPPEQQAAFAPQLQAMQAGQKQLADSLNAYTDGVAKASAGLNQLAAGATTLVKTGATLKKGVHSAIEPLFDLPFSSATTSAPESFLSASTVSSIQFVMKTDALSAAAEKADVLPAERPKVTFWDRLLALFGL